MVQIKKYAASGLYEGQVIKEFEDADQASEYLEGIRMNREAKGYQCDTDEENGLTIRIELSHDDLADVYTYEVSEANSEAEIEISL